jgi:hypothetical protein
MEGRSTLSGPFAPIPIPRRLDRILNATRCRCCRATDTPAVGSATVGAAVASRHESRRKVDPSRKTLGPASIRLRTMQQPPPPPQSSGSDLGGLRIRSLEGGSRGLGSAGTKNDAERDRGMDCSARGRGRSVRRFGSSRPIRAARDRRARSPHGHRRQAWRLPRDVDDDNHAGLRAHGSGFRQRDQVPVGVDRHEIPYTSGRSRRSVPSRCRPPTVAAPGRRSADRMGARP